MRINYPQNQGYIQPFIIAIHMGDMDRYLNASSHHPAHKHAINNTFSISEPSVLPSKFIYVINTFVQNNYNHDIKKKYYSSTQPSRLIVKLHLQSILLFPIIFKCFELKEFCTNKIFFCHLPSIIQKLQTSYRPVKIKTPPLHSPKFLLLR